MGLSYQQGVFGEKNSTFLNKYSSLLIHPASYLSSTHGFRTEIVSIVLLEISDLETAAAFGEQSQTNNRKGDGYFLVAWDGS
jgi:hypothetical protein